MKSLSHILCSGAAGLAFSLSAAVCQASSHMDAPLITLDPAANTTDVYAFISQQDGQQYLTTALSVYPFEEPGIGPNNYGFDDNVLYEIHVALGDDVSQGKKTYSYQFKFDTEYKNNNTILQAFLGPLLGNQDASGFDENQNLRQTYQVYLRDHYRRKTYKLGQGLVPPNNQGLVTPFYNQNDDGEMPARGGVSSYSQLDPYTQMGVVELVRGYQAFAGQRDDGFYGDIQSIFDLDFGFGGPNKPFDSQAGYNVHSIVLNIPISEISGEGTNVGVYATTSRRAIRILRSSRSRGPELNFGRFVQVGRQGNPLLNEGFVAIKDKDLYNRSEPVSDKEFFKKYALNPELATALGLNDSNREDIAAIFIPDLIKVDITTGPTTLAGDTDFNRLSVFGGDTLINDAGDVVPAGFPNGRRFGDDVIDIAVLALVQPSPSDLPLNIEIDKVSNNDISYNQVFPYAATPLNGRNHEHH